MDTDRHYLSTLFEPRSLAIVGASEREGTPGRQVTKNVLDAGYKGELYLVNPGHKRLFGHATCASPEELPYRVDLALICVGPDKLLEATEGCARAGVRHAVIMTGSYAQVGAGVTALHDQLREAARRHGMRLLGPDSLGFLRPSARLNASATDTPAKPGTIALISQSSGLFSAALDWGSEMTIGCSLAVAMGSERDIDFGEVLDFLVSDRQTESIFLIIESIGHARRFMSALRAAARCKPVLLLKIGRHALTRRASLANPKREAGDEEVFDAALRRAGVVRLSTLAQMQAAALALFSRMRPRGNRLAIVGNGSGPAILALDRATDLGLPLARLSAESEAALAQALPAHSGTANPVDLSCDATPAHFALAIRQCLKDEGTDGLLAIITPYAQTDATGIAQAIASEGASAGKPLLVVCLGGRKVQRAVEILREAAIPCFLSPEPAVILFSHLSSYHRAQRLLMQIAAASSERQAPRVESAQLVIDTALDEGRARLSAMEAKAVLAAFRVPIAQTVVARSATEAMVLAEELGLPVAMKISAPNVRRKSECGGVRLGLGDLAAVRDSYATMLKEVKRCRPDAEIDGVTIEPMVVKPEGIEVTIEILRDPVFGPTIALAMGGSPHGPEARSIALPPLNETLIRDLIEAIPARRRTPDGPSAATALEEALQPILARVSEIACQIPSVQRLAINPLIVDAAGGVAVDVQIEVARPSLGSGLYDHMAIHPYPVQLIRRFQTAAGDTVTIRPIRPEDAELEQRFVQALSPESRYMRFMSAIRELSATQLVRMTQIDYDRELALVATVPDGEDASLETEIGVARYVSNPDGESCEFAIVVADAWHGKGIARRLMHELIDAARERGLRVMTGDFLVDNARMIAFAQHLGFEIGPHREDNTLLRGSLKLEQ